MTKDFCLLTFAFLLLYEIDTYVFHGFLFKEVFWHIAWQSAVFFLVRRGREEQQKSNTGPSHVCKDRYFYANYQIFCAILTRFNIKQTYKQTNTRIFTTTEKKYTLLIYARTLLYKKIELIPCCIECLFVGLFVSRYNSAFRIIAL